jgi:hypothetical protein
VGQGDERRPALPAGRIVIAEGVVRRAFGDQIVLLNLTTGHYHGLNVIGGRMLDEIERTGDAQATAEAVAAEFDAPIETVAADLAELLGQLSERGLVVIDGG